MPDGVFEGPGPEAEYRSRLAAGQLPLQECSACGAVTARPLVLCPDCGAPALAWRRASGEGIVHAVTVVRSGPGRDQPYPYCVALVELAERVRLMSRVEGMAPDAVRIGLAVRAEIKVSEDGEALHVFRPVENGR